MSELKGKIDFTLFISATNANPNGDPLNGNRPRINMDGYGEISDVCIKRKIRNRLQDRNQKIFVQSDDKTDDSYTSLKDRADSCEELKKEMNTAVVIKMKQADKKNLSARAGKIIGKRPVYDFSVTGIKKKQSSVLKKGRIRVAVSYNASKKEKDKKIFAYKIDKYSAAVKIPGSYYDSDTKTVNFVSRGFFTVAVGCEK